MYESGLVATLEAVKAAAGLAGRENIKPHSLRHNVATRLMNNGAPIKAIQQALGHVQMSTTAIYLHLNEQEAKQVAHLSALPDAKPQPTPAQTTERESTRLRMVGRQDRERPRLHRIAR